MKIIGVIQARMGSTRLPGKILKPIINDISLLEFIIQRIEKVKIDWWIATTLEQADDITVRIGEKYGLNIFRGDSENVLSRFLSIGKISCADWFVRITADNPFVDEFRINEMIDEIPNLNHKEMLIGDFFPKNRFPIGYLPEIVSSEGLNFCDKWISESEFFHRMHVTSYLKPHHMKFFTNFELPFRPNWRWTIDTQEDYLMIKNLLGQESLQKNNFNYLEVVNFLDTRPDIVAINQQVKQKNPNEF